MTLIFIFNAGSGKLNAVLDAAHKILSPNTYSCHLCRLTHNPLTEKKNWKKFRKTSGINMEFYHKDEFLHSNGDWRSEFPVILMNKDGELREFLSKQELENYESAEELIKGIVTKMDP